MKNQIPAQLSFDDYSNQKDVVTSVKEEKFPYCTSCESEKISFVKEHKNNKDISVLCSDCQMISLIQFSTTSQKNEFVLFLKERDKIRRDKEWERKYDEERGRATPLIPPPPKKGWGAPW